MVPEHREHGHETDTASVADLIVGRRLCIDCIARKTSLSPRWVGEALAELAAVMQVGSSSVGSCEQCARVPAYRIA